jgi:hypothetical protein
MEVDKRSNAHQHVLTEEVILKSSTFKAVLE